MGSHMQFLLLVATLPLFTYAGSDLARGWGDDIAWRGLEEGLTQASQHKHPLMLVIHKSWCGACKSLKPKFANSKEITDLSEQFVMVNTVDDEEPKDPKYSPDGSYIPRIFFLTPDGEMMLDVFNESGSPQYKYYYYDTKDIVTSMIKAANLISDREEL